MGQKVVYFIEDRQHKPVAFDKRKKKDSLSFIERPTAVDLISEKELNHPKSKRATYIFTDEILYFIELHCSYILAFVSFVSFYAKGLQKMYVVCRMSFDNMI